MRPSLGVLITYYNEQDMLRECLKSILTQTERIDEILIYDDASQAPAQDYLPKDFPVKIIRGATNQGPSHGRNVLLNVSESDYIHFQDADDLFFPNWSRHVRQVIDETMADLILTEMSCYSWNRPIRQRALGLEQLHAGEDLIPFWIKNGAHTPSSTCRRKAALAIGGFRESLRQVEDFDYHVRLAVSGVSYALITEPLIIWRRRPSSYSAQNPVVSGISHLEVVRLLSRELPPKYHLDLAEMAAYAGSLLFQVEAYDEARSAFNLAYQLGPPRFSRQWLPYRWIAQRFGPDMAEKIGLVYRKILPGKVRYLLRQRFSGSSK